MKLPANLIYLVLPLPTPHLPHLAAAVFAEKRRIEHELPISWNIEPITQEKIHLQGLRIVRHSLKHDFASMYVRGYSICRLMLLFPALDAITRFVRHCFSGFCHAEDCL